MPDGIYRRLTTRIVTTHGLRLPEDFTEDEFFEVGRFLAKAVIEEEMQWAIGDWFNAIPWGDKHAACEKAGLSFERSRVYAAVCRAFPVAQERGSDWSGASGAEEQRERLRELQSALAASESAIKYREEQ